MVLSAFGIDQKAREEVCELGFLLLFFLLIFVGVT
mgnify:CR=1 FL=1